MAELRVPTLSVEVDVVYADETFMSGTIYLPALAHRHEGPMRPDEWINDNMPFFPFFERGSTRAILLNKDRVVVLSVPMMTEERDVPSEMETTAKVRIDCGTHQVSGTVRIDMPEGKTRVLDYLNRGDKFIPLFDEERVHLIRKIFIDRVVEVRED